VTSEKVLIDRFDEVGISKTCNSDPVHFPSVSVAFRQNSAFDAWSTHFLLELESKQLQAAAAAARIVISFFFSFPSWIVLQQWKRKCQGCWTRTKPLLTWSRGWSVPKSLSSDTTALTHASSSSHLAERCGAQSDEEKQLMRLLAAQHAPPLFTLVVV
tara:strand:+ start:64 stop:537 length:474 start_codon:yes stop_codon:yes gene_type:complete